jgi:hypothetical protein
VQARHATAAASAHRGARRDERRTCRAYCGCGALTGAGACQAPGYARARHRRTGIVLGASRPASTARLGARLLPPGVEPAPVGVDGGTRRLGPDCDGDEEGGRRPGDRKPVAGCISPGGLDDARGPRPRATRTASTASLCTAEAVEHRGRRLPKPVQVVVLAPQTDVALEVRLQPPERVDDSFPMAPELTPRPAPITVRGRGDAGVLEKSAQCRAGVGPCQPDRGRFREGGRVLGAGRAGEGALPRGHGGEVYPAPATPPGDARPGSERGANAGVTDTHPSGTDPPPLLPSARDQDGATRHGTCSGQRRGHRSPSHPVCAVDAEEARPRGRGHPASEPGADPASPSHRPPGARVRPLSARLSPNRWPRRERPPG